MAWDEESREDQLKLEKLSNNNKQHSFEEEDRYVNIITGLLFNIIIIIITIIIIIIIIISLSLLSSSSLLLLSLSLSSLLLLTPLNILRTRIWSSLCLQMA